MFYLEETYGNDGFATFLKILRELAKTDYHYLNLSKPTTMMFLSAKCKISKETLDSIIKDLVDLEKFDPVLWNENKIIWCQDFIDSIQDAYSKRKNKCITYDGLLVLLSSLRVRKPIKRDSLVHINTQSIVEYSKKEETTVKKESDNSSYSDICKDDVIWLEAIAMKCKVRIDVVKLYLDNFVIHLLAMDEYKRNIKEFKIHYVNWIQKQDLSQHKTKRVGRSNQIR